MTLEATYQAALQQDVVNAFTAVEILHPVHSIRLLDGPGFLTFAGHTFVGHDDLIGSLAAVDVGEEGAGSQSPEATIDILPVSMAVGGTYGIPTAQGAIVRVFAGAFDPPTGAVIGTPDLRFIGELDQIDWARGEAGAAGTVLRITASSGFERFFDTDEGARLSDAFHKSIWAGELGYSYMTTILEKMPWGREGQRPAVTAIITTTLNGVLGRRG